MKNEDLIPVFEKFYREFVEIFVKIEEEDKDAYLMNLLYSILNGVYGNNTKRALIEMALRAIDQEAENDK